MVVLRHQRHVFVWDRIVHVEKVVLFGKLVSGLLLAHLAVGRLNYLSFYWRLDCWLGDFLFGFVLNTDPDVTCCYLGAFAGLKLSNCDLVTYSLCHCIFISKGALGF